MISQQPTAIHDHLRRLAELREEMDNMRRAYGFGEPCAVSTAERMPVAPAGFPTLPDGSAAAAVSRV
jgi:hypothetical protein